LSSKKHFHPFLGREAIRNNSYGVGEGRYGADFRSVFLLSSDLAAIALMVLEDLDEK